MTALDQFLFIPHYFYCLFLLNKYSRNLREDSKKQSYKSIYLVCSIFIFYFEALNSTIYFIFLVFVQLSKIHF